MLDHKDHRRYADAQELSAQRFAQLLASGKTATDAYEEAGYKRSHSNGPALAKSEEISARVAQISAERWKQEQATAAVAAERSAITRQSLVEKIEEARQAAMEAGQYSAAVSAAKEIGVCWAFALSDPSVAHRVSLTGLIGSTLKSCVRWPRVSLTSRRIGKTPAR
jgi:hypothetical protein